MPLYFAYGSNMSENQMEARCKGARPLGQARLDGWRFIVNTRGTASIITAAGASVHGVLWRCSADHFRVLDAYEGVPQRHLFRRSVETVGVDGTLRRATTYAGVRFHQGVGSINYFTTAVLPGALAFGLPADYIAEIESWLPQIRIGEKRQRYRSNRRIRIHHAPRRWKS